MLRRTLMVSLIVCGLAGAAVAGPEKPITSVKSLAGDWRAVGGATAAAIRIKTDGSYEGTSANGAKTAGKITATGGKGSFQSTSAVGSVAWSQEGGNDVLTFMRADGRGTAKLQRVK
jgi:hypothetical protein